jgi:alkylation response protein AidB-like acyl-CoA dehydrogenase
VTVHTIKQITGQDEFCEVFYDNALVEPEDVLGGEQEGWPAAVKVLEVERATNRMYRAWRMENELRHLVCACKSDARLRELIRESHYAQRLAGFQVDVDILKAYVESVVEDLVNGNSIGGRGSLMKLHWSEAHQRLATLALELLDKAEEPPNAEIEAARRRFRAIYLYSRAATIYAGTSQIQLGIIADRIMRLPRSA